MGKKIYYVDNEGNEMKRVVIYFEVTYTGATLETFLTVPKGMTDEEIMLLAKSFRNTETKCGFYYPDEDEE